MADISQVKLPSGTTYNLKDANARTRIEALENAAVSGITYIGTSSTEITDGGNQKPTIDGTAVTPVNGNLVFYGNKEFVFTGTWNATLSQSGKWEEFGDMGSLGTLAYKNSASGTFTPAGSVSSTFSGTAGTYTGSFTPSGSVSSTFTGSKYNLSGSIAANGVSVSGNYDKATGVTVATAAPGSGQTATYTPAGTVSKPGVTVTPTTTTVTEVASVGSLPTRASVSSKFTVANEVLTIGDFYEITGVGSLPTTNNETVMTGATASLASTPSFTGTGVMITATPSHTSTAVTSKNSSAISVSVSATANSSGSFQPGGTVSSSFTGTAGTVSVSGTPAGSVSSSFTGTAGTVTVS